MSDQQFATISMVLPREIVAGIAAFARQRGLRTGALIRLALRRVGAPIPDDQVLGFAAEPPPSAH